MVFTGNANPRLAQEVAKHLNLSLGRAIVGKFSDGEVMVELLENVRGKDVFVLQSTCAPTNDNLMELLRDDRRAQALLGGARHRGDPVFRLCAPGPAPALGARGDQRESGGEHAHLGGRGARC